MERNTLIAICVVALVTFGGVGLNQGWFTPIEEGTGDPGAQTNVFSVNGKALDTNTAVTSASIKAWYDVNKDGVLQYSELGGFSEASGVYTSGLEYPIDYSYTDEDGNIVYVTFDIWVQIYATNYQVTYQKVHMNGQRNAGGEAKSAGDVFLIATDDSLTWSGLMNGVAFDTTDYNYTTNGATGTLKAECILSAADKGISSQIWEGVDYQTIYGLTKPNDYVVKWDQITEGVNDDIVIAKGSVLAPTFFAAYLTVQDKVDGAPDAGYFDIDYSDGTNWFFLNTVSSTWGDLFYNTADSSAPRPTVEFEMGTMTAAGTFAATYGIGLWQGVTYDEMIAGTWTKGTDLALGTSGDGWAWI